MIYYNVPIWDKDKDRLLKLELAYAQKIGQKVTHAEYINYLITKEERKL